MELWSSRGSRKPGSSSSLQPSRPVYTHLEGAGLENSVLPGGGGAAKFPAAGDVWTVLGGKPGDGGVPEGGPEGWSGVVT